MAHPGGRPTDYDPEYARMAKEIIRHSGFTVANLCKVFGVARATIYNWMGDYPEFLDAINEGRRIWDGIKIHRSLVKRATGFNYTETTQERAIDNETGEATMVVTRKVRKFIPPDVSAIKHWQVNRDKNNWTDKQQLDITEKDETFDAEERAALKKLARNMAENAMGLESSDT